MRAALTPFLLCATALALPIAAHPQTVVDGPGVYSTYGSQSYGPYGVQSQYGGVLSGPSGVYSRFGAQIYGPSGAYSTYGNTTYGPDGSTATTYGNSTYISGPNGAMTCSQYGDQTYCN